MVQFRESLGATVGSTGTAAFRAGIADAAAGLTCP
jgi:hypothetical protein